MKSIHKAYAFIVLWLALGLAAVFYTPDFGKPVPAVKDSAPELSKSEASSGARVRVCTWNLRNYLVTRRNIDGKWKFHPKPEEEKNAICSVLAQINPDVLVVQEMGDVDFLLELRERLKSKGLSFKYYAISQRSAPSRLALLSKFSPVEVFDSSSLKFPFKGENKYSPRGSLGAKFNSGGVNWIVFGMHLKSKFGAKKADNGFADFRDAELDAILQKLSRYDSFPRLLCGDFNDEIEKSNLKRILLKFSFVQIPQTDDSGRSYSYFWAKKNLRFVYDCFLADVEMRNFIDAGSAVVFESQTVDASDHRPVYIDLDFSKDREN